MVVDPGPTVEHRRQALHESRDRGKRIWGRVQGQAAKYFRGSLLLTLVSLHVLDVVRTLGLQRWWSTRAEECSRHMPPHTSKITKMAGLKRGRPRFPRVPAGEGEVELGITARAILRQSIAVGILTRALGRSLNLSPVDAVPAVCLGSGGCR